MTTLKTFFQLIALLLVITSGSVYASDRACDLDSSGNTIVKTPQVGGGRCLTDAKSYIVKLYRIGLCNNLQFTNTSNNFYNNFPDINGANCTTIWKSGATPVTVDISSTTSLSNLANSPVAVTPVAGTYNYAYLVISNTVSAKAVVNISDHYNNGSPISSVQGSTGSGMTCWTVDSNDDVNNYKNYTQNLCGGNAYSSCEYSAYNLTTKCGSAVDGSLGYVNLHYVSINGYAHDSTGTNYTAFYNYNAHGNVNDFTYLTGNSASNPTLPSDITIDPTTVNSDGVVAFQALTAPVNLTATSTLDVKFWISNSMQVMIDYATNIMNLYPYHFGFQLTSE